MSRKARPRCGSAAPGTGMWSWMLCPTREASSREVASGRNGRACAPMAAEWSERPEPRGRTARSTRADPSSPMVSDGKFTQELSMARFNNQDTEVTRGVSNKKINVSKGKITNVNPHKDSGDINRNVPDRMMGKIGQKIKKSKAYKRIQGFY